MLNKLINVLKFLSIITVSICIIVIAYRYEYVYWRLDIADLITTELNLKNN